MNKPCSCGAPLKLRMRTVVYARKVKIIRVPVLCCGDCGCHEVYAGVKADIGRLIGKLGPRPESQTISFDEINECAGVLSQALDDGNRTLHPALVARAAQERTNELLDLWLIASSLGDERWKSELSDRLSQLRHAYIS